MIDLEQSLVRVSGVHYSCFRGWRDVTVMNEDSTFCLSDEPEKQKDKDKT